MLQLLQGEVLAHSQGCQLRSQEGVRKDVLVLEGEVIGNMWHRRIDDLARTLTSKLS